MVRVRRALLTAALMGGSLLAGGALLPTGPAHADPDLICHGTGSATNPFVLIDVPPNSAHFKFHLPSGQDVLPTFINGVPNCPVAGGGLAPLPITLAEAESFANAEGGNGGSARGGDGGRGGDGFAPQCNQNTNDTYWGDEPPTVSCGAGGIGGDAGDGGISDAGDGGVAFTDGFA